MTISIFKWFELIRGLRKKGNGERESGAFLVAKTGSLKISKVIFYDDLDPDAFSSGIIVLEGIYHSKLNKILKEFKGEVIADIHSHPIGCSINQSASDMNHPMCRLKGHVAFIAPDYATNSFLMPKQCAAYLYKGSFIWQTLINNNFPLKITLL